MLSGDTHDVDASVARALAVEAQDSIDAGSPQGVRAYIERPNAALGHIVVMVGRRPAESGVTMSIANWP